MTERIPESMLQLRDAIKNLAISFERMPTEAFATLSMRKGRVSYNGKYWKMIDNNHFDR